MPKKQTMYLETSVISAYFDFWKHNQQQKRETRLLWKLILPKFKVYISDIDIVEIDNTKDELWKAKMQQLIKGLTRLKTSDRIQALAQDYCKYGILPSSKINDALHLAVAVLHDIDYFLTWNFEHLSRPHQKKKILEFNQTYKLSTPIIIEPTEFVKDIFYL